MYESMVMIPPNVALEFATVADKIEARFTKLSSPPQIERQADQLTLRWDEWTFRIYWETGSTVTTESQEIAQFFAASRADKAIIAACDRRITTAGEPDPDMEHFNEYVTVLEVLEMLSDVYIFDSTAGQLQKVDEHG